MRYRVDGMTCGGCERSLTAVLKRIGDVEVSASHTDRTVEVTGVHTEDAVKQAVQKAGFAYGGVLPS